MGIDALAQQVYIEETVSKEFLTRAIIDLTGKRTDNGNNNPLLDPNLRQTSGMYYVQLFPKPGAYQRLKFIVSGDIFKTSQDRVRIEGWDDLVSRAEENLEVKWLLENTTISKFDFDLAEQNILVRIPVMLDYKKYTEKLGTMRLRNAETEEYVLRAKNYKSSGGRMKKCN